MKSYIAFTKKEFVECFRTYKLLLVVVLFIILGIMNPITAKLTPILIENFMPVGINIEIMQPTAMDSWMQFYKNVPQMGIVVLAIVFSGMMGHELSKGTLINMLTKGLDRSKVILSKFSMAVTVWSICVWLSFGITYGYTVYFWSMDYIQNLVFSVTCLWIFGIFFISIMLIAGVIVKTSYGCLMITVGAVAVMFIINIVPTIQKFNPIKLAGDNMSLLSGVMQPKDFLESICVTIVLIIVLIVGAIGIFNKKQI